MCFQAILLTVFIAGSLNAAWLEETDLNNLDVAKEVLTIIEDGVDVFFNETENSQTLSEENKSGKYKTGHPYQAAIFLSDKFHSSGAILDKYHIITEVFLPVDSKHLTVGVGETSISEKQKKWAVKNVFVHPEYSFGTDNSVAILKLKKGLKFSKGIKSVRLPKNASKSKSKATVSGWGAIKDDSEDKKHKPHKKSALTVLKETVLDHKKCKTEFWASFVSDTVICGTNKKLNEKLEPGSPLVQNSQLIGLSLSHPQHSNACKKKECPSVYTDIYKLRKWIQKTIKQKETIDALL